MSYILGIMRNFTGSAALLFSAALASATLLALRRVGSDGFERAQLLMVGNFFCALLLFVPKVSGRPLLPSRPLESLACLMWAVSYSAGYSVFVLFPQYVSLSELVVAQSLAPFVAIITSGDWRNVGNNRLQLAATLAPIGLLLWLAALMQSHDLHANRPATSFLMFLIFACYVGTNTAARWIARTRGPFWGQPRVAALVSLLLLGFLAFTGKALAPPDTAVLLMQGCAFGIAILLIQSSFIGGLSSCPPLPAALCIAASVPIAILLEAWINGTQLTGGVLLVSFAYCASILFRGGLSILR